MTEMTVRAQKVAGGMLALTASAHFLNDMIQDSSGICVGSSSPDFGQREPVNKYGESPR